MSDPYAAAAGFDGSLAGGSSIAHASTSTMPSYRMPDGSFTTNERLARQTWIDYLERERVKNGG